MIRGIIVNQRKPLSELHKKLKQSDFANAETLVPQCGNPVTFPKGKIGWVKECKDVCGYPSDIGLTANLV